MNVLRRRRGLRVGKRQTGICVSQSVGSLHEVQHVLSFVCLTIGTEERTKL